MKPILTMISVLTLTAPPAIADKLQTLEEKYELYATLSRDAQDDWGNVHSMCDGLIFTSVYFLAGGYADINQPDLIQDSRTFSLKPSVCNLATPCFTLYRRNYLAARPYRQSTCC